MADYRTFWFGKPGMLQKLVVPGNAMPQTTDRAASLYRLASGGVRGDKLLDGRKQITLAYNGLTADSFNALAAYHEGAYGPGPFAFLNPAQRNMLTRNQSSTGSQAGDTSGFTLTPGTTADLLISLESPTSVTGNALMPMSIQAGFTAATPTSPTLHFDPASGDWPWGIPCAVRHHSFGFWARAFGDNNSVSIQPTLIYKDKFGSTLATISATAATATATWRQYKVEGALAPSDTAYVEPVILMDGSTIGAGEGIRVWQAMLNEGSMLDLKWVAGTGVYPVMIMNLDDTPMGWDTTARQSPNLVLQEVG